jgi:hypothetical protein
MRTLLFLLLMLLSRQLVSAQGTVNFANLVPDPSGGYLVSRPVYALDNTTRPEGPDWVAQLFVGPPGAVWFSGLKPVGPPAPFQTGIYAGYWVPGIREVPGMPAGSIATLGVAVWPLYRGSTCEEAELASLPEAGSWIGLGRYVLGGDGLPPAILEGLRIAYVPEPSTLWLGALAGATLLALRPWKRSVKRHCLRPRRGSAPRWIGP